MGGIQYEVPERILKDIKKDYIDGMTIRRMSEKYGLNPASLYEKGIYRAFGGRENTPRRNPEYDRKGTVNRNINVKKMSIKNRIKAMSIDIEDIPDILDKYAAGETPELLAKKYNVDIGDIMNIIFRGNINNIKNDMEENKMGKRKLTKKSKNSSKPPKNQVVIEETTEDITAIEFSSHKYINDKITFCDSNHGIIETVMISDRHRVGIEDAIFETMESEQISDLRYQQDTVHKYIDNKCTFGDDGNCEQTLVVYCTGLQVALGSIVKVCLDRHVNLILKHYDPTNGCYYKQTVIDLFGDIPDDRYPFGKLQAKGDVYLYDSTLEEVINNDNMYSISINQMDEGDNFLGRSKYIVFKNGDDIWPVYAELVKMIQADRSTKNSVLLAKCYTTEDDFRWNDNISKSYNYK